MFFFPWLVIALAFISRVLKFSICFKANVICSLNELREKFYIEKISCFNVSKIENFSKKIKNTIHVNDQLKDCVSNNLMRYAINSKKAFCIEKSRQHQYVCAILRIWPRGEEKVTL